MAIVAGALANWFMLSMIFSIWFDITKDKSTNPTLYAALWAGGLMVVLIGLALTPVSEAFFRFCNGCRRLIHTEEDRLRPLFEDVCARAKLNPDKYELFTQDDKFPNAFAMGRKTVCITRGLFLVYSDEDIKGILAHEMGHHVYGDAVRGIVFFMITLVGQVIMWGSWLVGKILSLLPFLAGSEGSREREHAGIFTAFANVVWVIMWLFQIFVWIPIQIGACFGSRQQEYRADAYAAKIGYRKEILEFLTNILDLEGRPKGFMGLLYRTHPKIGDRIRRLEDMDVNALPDAPGQRPGVWARIASIVKERFERTADALRRERPLKDESRPKKARTWRMPESETAFVSVGTAAQTPTWKPKTPEKPATPKRPAPSWRKDVVRKSVSRPAWMKNAAENTLLSRFIVLLMTGLLCLLDWFITSYALSHAWEVSYYNFSIWGQIVRVVIYGGLFCLLLIAFEYKPDEIKGRALCRAVGLACFGAMTASPIIAFLRYKAVVVYITSPFLSAFFLDALSGSLSVFYALVAVIVCCYELFQQWKGNS